MTVHGDVIGQGIVVQTSCRCGSRTPAKICLHQFLVVCGAHGGSPLIGCCQSWRRRPAFFQSIVNMIYIHLMNLNSLDLNLLVALDALLQGSQRQPRGDADRAVAAGREPRAAAAARPARRSLLVRVGARMEFIPRALALRGPLAQALDQVRGLFVSDEFDAAAANGIFA